MSDSDSPPRGITVPAVVDNPAAHHAGIAAQRGWAFVDLDVPGFTVDPAAAEALSARDVRRHEALPLSVNGNQVTVAVADPDDPVKASQLRMLLSGKTMRMVYGSPLTLRRLIDTVYSASTEAEKLSTTASQARTVPTAATLGAAGSRVSSGPEGEQVAMLRLILEQGLREGASDIHIEPTETHLEIRNRVDGRLHVAGRHPLSAARGLVTLIKVQAEMRPDNFLIPDSGVLYYSADGGRQIDIRVETAPGVWGTSAVMRLQSEIWRKLDDLGFSAENERRFRLAVSQPYGLVLVTGPTGSGKSTTLYSAVRELISPSRKIITLENPVEYKVAGGVSQMSVNDEQGMTLSRGLRSILRQDPDVILIGEVRDTESAETAIDSSTTGHLVLSTIHANGATGIVPRLVRMGIDPFLVASSLTCVVGQRLARRLCDACKEPARRYSDAIVRAGFDPDEVETDLYIASPEGCPECTEGYKGRVPVHEVMLVSPDLAQAITDNAPAQALAAAAAAAGMTTMRQDGWEKVRAGLTSLAALDETTMRALV